jgi:hypothetical protein
MARLPGPAAFPAGRASRWIPGRASRYQHIGEFDSGHSQFVGALVNPGPAVTMAIPGLRMSLP